MAVTRLYVKKALSPGQEIQLDKDQARYLGRVLRLGAGDPVRVFNGEGGEFAATALNISRGAAALRIGEFVDTPTESRLRTHLVQGISRGERMDFAIQKATELGVKRITPVLTEHGVVKLDAARAARRRVHWQNVAASACEQSGRTRPPLIDEPLDLNAWFGQRTSRTDTDLILHPGATASLASVTAPKTKVCLLIGPEGGFSGKEFDDAAVAGFQAISLGPRVLRTETAALTALAVAQLLWGDLGDVT